MALFIPRAVFPTLDSLPRSYFLGHHRVGLTKMKAMLSSVDLVIECRDYRVPLTSQNPLFEESLAGKERLVVYTKQDLGSEGREEDRRVCETLMSASGLHLDVQGLFIPILCYVERRDHPPLA